jgi:hypothetical protein
MGFWCVPVQNENKSKRGLRQPKELSALGHKQTLEQASEMSALPTKADMRPAVQKYPLSARSGHSWPLG